MVERDELRDAGLRFSSDSKPGIRRLRKGKGFAYVLPNGEKPDAKIIDRIKALVIPPAWADVWISPDAKGFLQATGRDAKGRKQSLYHPCWRAHREATKFDKLGELARVLPRIRARVEEDLRKRGFPKERVVAAVVKLLDETLIRVGNREYARDNGSYGLTTLRVDHLESSSNTLMFRFVGKSGKEHEVEYRDRRLARLVNQIHDLPGQALFQYQTVDGDIVELNSSDVNDYLREVSGADFTAKDFRTWAATVEAVRLIREGDGDAKDAQVVKLVAKRLGNTPAVCRKAYIHPFALESREWLQAPLPRGARYMSREERLVEWILSSYSKEESTKSTRWSILPPPERSAGR